MSLLERSLRELCDDLSAAKREIALVGGLAVSVRSEPRFTRDADLAVVVGDDADAESLVRELQTRGYSVAAIVEQEATAQLASVRLLPPPAFRPGVVLDLLFASSGIEREVVTSAETLSVFPGLELPVARTGHLIALKVLSRDDRSRPQDIVDLRALLSVATPGEIGRAREALRLIESRGFHRDRALVSMLDNLLQEDDPGNP